MSVHIPKIRQSGGEQSRNQQLACNVGQHQSNESDKLNTIRTAINPKFIKELNAQQNLKRKRQLRKKQQSVLFDNIKRFTSMQSRLQWAITPNFKVNFFDKKGISQKQLQFILEQAQQAKMNKENKEAYISGKPIKGKVFKKREEILRDGNRIIGEWRNQQLHGDVQIYYKNGFFFRYFEVISQVFLIQNLGNLQFISFRGRYEHGIRIRGYFNFSNGYEYTGGFLGDKFRGYGQLKLPNGKVICGDWQEQLLDGKAEIRYPTGQVYYGQIKNFKKHGKGYLFFNDGQKYVGEFFQGHITGNGEYYENQKLIGKGYWLDGELMYEQKQLQQKEKSDFKTQNLKIQKNKTQSNNDGQINSMNQKGVLDENQVADNGQLAKASVDTSLKKTKKSEKRPKTSKPKKPIQEMKSSRTFKCSIAVLQQPRND